REYRRLRVTADDCIGQHVGEVKVTSGFERSLRRESHAFPEWFSTVVERFLTRVFSVFRAGWTTEVRQRTAVGVPHVDVGLELKNKLTERRAVSLGNRGLRT